MLHDTSLIKEYFNEKASSWDKNNIPKDEILDLLFNEGSLINGCSILDVGCGTGILFNYFNKKNAKSITGIDISKNMIDIAKLKYPNIKLICDNILSFDDENKYDVVVLYNTLPHIYDLDLLFANIKKLLIKDGKLIIAFGQSRDKTNLIHKSVPDGISFELPTLEDLCRIISKYFNIDYSISDDVLYEIICLNKD